MRRHIIDNGVRPDGRKLTEIRPIWCEVGVLPASARLRRVHPRPDAGHDRRHPGAHGLKQQIIDGIGTEEDKRYMHHYNFPGYSTGEAKPLRSPGRREIGHGALAERALQPMIPVGRGVPLLPAPGVRGHVLQRLHLAGFRLRLHAGADGRGRADQAPRGWRAPWA